MEIAHINDQIKIVTDIDEAISQPELFKDLQHKDPAFSDQDETLKIYWTDFYEKLLRLKQELDCKEEVQK
jgi:hypothetical protein